MPDMLHIEDPGAWRGMKGRLFACLQSVYRIGAAFVAHQGTLRAAALTYTTLLSLVPLLAIAFAVLKGFGVQNTLEPALQELVGDSEETIASLISYVNNTNVKSLGVIGLLMLVVTVISLLGSIEEAFNATWGVEESRPLQRRFSDYLSVVVVGPILLLAATSMNTGLQSQWLVQWLIEHTYLGDTILLLFRMVPYLLIWLTMTFVYIFIPNTKVHFRSAVIGGVLAGTAWQVAQWGYFHFQVGVANYNAIYGTMAALPIFLVWVYTSWLIVLFGLEVVYAHQHRAPRSVLSGVQTATVRELLALSTLVLVCRHFHDGSPAPTAEQLAAELDLPLKDAVALLAILHDLHFLVEVSEDGSGWLPAREPATIMLAEVLTALRGILPLAEDMPAACGPVRALLDREAALRSASLRGVTLQELVMKSSTGSGPARGEK